MSSTGDKRGLRGRDAADHNRRARELRRAEALRENLRRRKAQLRERGGDEAAGDDS